ncbi:MAG: hypothetical protein WCD79_21005 [Chthoniobacteraceae bacterium]
MTIEQRCELNEFLHRGVSSAPSTFKEKAKLFAPALFLLLAPCAGMAFLHGVPIADCLGRIVGLLIVLVVMGSINYLSTRWLQTAKRKLETKDNGVYLSPSQQRRIPWKLVKAWHFELVENRSDLMKITLKWSLGVNPHCWSILSTKDEQESFLAELQERQRLGCGHFSMQTFRAPIQYPPFKAKPVATWLYIVSALFLVGGMVLLATLVRQRSAEPSHPVRVNPVVRHYLQEFHNKSAEQRQRITLSYSALLLVPGALGLVLSMRILKRNARERREANDAAEASVRLRQWPSGE